MQAGHFEGGGHLRGTPGKALGVRNEMGKSLGRRDEKKRRYRCVRQESLISTRRSRELERDTIPHERYTAVKVHACSEAVRAG